MIYLINIDNIINLNIINILPPKIVRKYTTTTIIKLINDMDYINSYTSIPDANFQRRVSMDTSSVQHRQEIGGDICLTTLEKKETFDL